VTALRAYPVIDTAWERLAAFLGESFDPRYTDYYTCCGFVEEEFRRLGARFYEANVGYLYELTHFHFSPYKDGVQQVLLESAARYGWRDFADVGAGIGLDAQALAAIGFEMTLYDIEGRPLQYARWRLAHDDFRGCGVRAVQDLGRTAHDCVYAVDTLEHVAEPHTLIDAMFRAGRFVCVNVFDHSTQEWDGVDMHYPQDHHDLLGHLSDRGRLRRVARSGETHVLLWERR
jgi:hypothetical protein